MLVVRTIPRNNVTHLFKDKNFQVSCSDFLHVLDRSTKLASAEKSNETEAGYCDIFASNQVQHRVRLEEEDIGYRRFDGFARVVQGVLRVEPCSDPGFLVIDGIYHDLIGLALPVGQEASPAECGDRIEVRLLHVADHGDALVLCLPVAYELLQTLLPSDLPLQAFGDVERRVTLDPRRLLPSGSDYLRLARMVKAVQAGDATMWMCPAPSAVP